MSLLLLSLPAFANGKCSLTDPSLTLQSYTVNPQRERIVMYWQKADGEAWGSLRSLLADINQNGQVQMAMNGGIYDKAYAPLGLYIEKGRQLTPEESPEKMTGIGIYDLIDYVTDSMR